ncbi:MAG: hypothetical protein IJ635_01050 [Bacteroidaceae bacterium]|nr:hypothetical protein [Bacteroidaceae bacterium]
MNWTDSLNSNGEGNEAPAHMVWLDDDNATKTIDNPVQTFSTNGKLK